jgi:hypothetical protein
MCFEQFARANYRLKTTTEIYMFKVHIRFVGLVWYGDDHACGWRVSCGRLERCCWWFLDVWWRWRRLRPPQLGLCGWTASRYASIPYVLKAWTASLYASIAPFEILPSKTLKNSASFAREKIQNCNIMILVNFALGKTTTEIYICSKFIFDLLP